MKSSLLKGIVLFVLFWPALAPAQEEIRLDILPSKISTDIQMIVPYGEGLIYERYFYFKHNYWVSQTDTLERLDNGMFRGKSILINPETYNKKVDSCDTLVNKIRNAALNHKLLSELRALSRKDIGYDNKEFHEGLYTHRPTENDEKAKCHEEFKIISLEWFSDQNQRIEEIKKNKIQRHQWIKDNHESIDKEFLKAFLQDFGSCDSDRAAIIDLMKNNTDDFLAVCKDLNDSDFFLIKLKLSVLPSHIKTNEVIQQLRDSGIRTGRKRKLIRKLKKNAR